MEGGGFRRPKGKMGAKEEHFWRLREAKKKSEMGLLCVIEQDAIMAKENKSVKIFFPTIVNSNVGYDYQVCVFTITWLHYVLYVVCTMVLLSVVNSLLVRVTAPYYYSRQVYWHHILHTSKQGSASSSRVPFGVGGGGEGGGRKREKSIGLRKGEGGGSYFCNPQKPRP